MPDLVAEAVSSVASIPSVPTILDVIRKVTGIGFAAVARVTDDRWITCSVREDIGFGLAPGDELKVETTICHEIRQNREPVVIDDTDADPHWAAHHTPRLYGLRSYISVPIVLPDGSFFGTLCAIDRVPRPLNTAEIRDMFRLFAELIAFHIDAGNRLRVAETDLRAEKHDSELREQFIAVLGHDLRNPLASISAGARMLQKRNRDEVERELIGMMQGSVARMTALIDDVMDFARARMGSGLAIAANEVSDPSPVLEQVVAEMRSIHPARSFEVQIEPTTLRCDGPRIGQLLSNLLTNAVIHGAADSPIRVIGKRHDDGYALSVTNSGDPITTERRAELFRPFVRSADGSQQGLGLGLYIASEIARAHGGQLSVWSEAGETCFTLTLPSAARGQAVESMTLENQAR